MNYIRGKSKHRSVFAYSPFGYFEAIDFALHREDSAAWKDIGLGISSLDENEKNI
jgi:hypothetical protein